MQQNATHPPLEISDDKGRLDVPLIHRFVSEEAYWCRGIPHSTVERAINHSLCVGGYVSGQLVAFARVITDRATFGYLGARTNARVETDEAAIRPPRAIGSLLSYRVTAAARQAIW
ncbi:hypothetical protein WP9W18E04_08250 [Aeromonas veronii]|nr:hypothetical protein WP9W18E04_08250 [Aeromonas veronii]